MPYLLFLKKRQTLQSSSAAMYRWCFKGKRNTISVSNRLDPDQDQDSVGSDLGPNCLQRFSADNL